MLASNYPFSWFSLLTAEDHRYEPVHSTEAFVFLNYDELSLKIIKQIKPPILLSVHQSLPHEKLHPNAIDP